MLLHFYKFVGNFLFILQNKMFPLREARIFMSSMRREGFDYMIVAHDGSDAPPLRTHVEESTLDLVSGIVSRFYQGVDEDNFSLLEEEEEEEEEFRWAIEVLTKLN